MKKTIAIIFVCVLLGAISMLLGAEVVTRETQIKEMDARELHYDADNWFIIVDKDKGLIGIYFADLPVAHIKADTELFHGDVIEIPTLILGDDQVDKSEWWLEGHTASIHD